MAAAEGGLAISTMWINGERRQEGSGHRRQGKLCNSRSVQRLDKFTPEEALMAAAEAMTVTRDIDDTVKGVDKRLENVDKRAQDTDGRVSSVIQGRLLTYSSLYGPRIRTQRLLC
jgi:hypothetical protein